MALLSILLQIVAFLLPWPVRRPLLNGLLGYRIDRSARIGFSVISAREVIMERGARIGSLTFIRGLSELRLGENALLGNMNWVSAIEEGHPTAFLADLDRRPALIICREAAVTHRHLLDCNDTIEIGQFATFAGWGSQVLTHSIDLRENRQRAAPVRVGEYSFVGTRCVLLKGASLPARSLLSAGSVLGTPEIVESGLYSGVPAQFRKELASGEGYFSRREGVVS